MIDPPCKIPYQPRWGGIIVPGLFFALCAVGLGEKASTNDRGLILEGIFHLSPWAATVFYWVLTAFSALFVLASLLLAIKRVTSNQFLQLEHDAVIVPHGFLLKKSARVPYASIAGISEMNVKRQRSLRLFTPDRKYAISASMLPNNEVYQQVKQLIVERVGAVGH